MKYPIATVLMALTATLGGFTQAYAQANASAPMASSASPDASTVSTKKSMRTANRLLARSVRKALTKNGEIDVSHLTVIAKDGVVTLEGSVPDNDQISSAEDGAVKVSGVKNVINRLTVATSGH